MVSQIWVNISSGNGLLPDGTKPLLEPMLTHHHPIPGKDSLYTEMGTRIFYSIQWNIGKNVYQNVSLGLLTNSSFVHIVKNALSTHACSNMPHYYEAKIYQSHALKCPQSHFGYHVKDFIFYLTICQKMKREWILTLHNICQKLYIHCKRKVSIFYQTTGLQKCTPIQQNLIVWDLSDKAIVWSNASSGLQQ